MIPVAEGYSFPAEWSPHKATWLSWPHNPHTWPNGLAKIYPTLISLIKIISQEEEVCIQVNDRAKQQEVEELLRQYNVPLMNIRFFYHPTNDAWCRDHGPAFLTNPKNRKKLVVNWDYNAWGGKYPPYDLDNGIPEKIAKAMDIEMVNPGMVLEGGSVDFNGAGTLLTTSCCLLHKNRNPGHQQTEITEKLCDYYGVKQVLWLHHGIAGDDTDGHIDDICRFVKEDVVVAAVEQNPTDRNFQPLQENLRRLHDMRLWDGRPLKIITLPMPKPLFWKEQRLPASYANFYMCNAAVIVPTFDDPQDQVALSSFQELITDRPVLGLDSRELVVGLGSFHCLTQQEPSL